MALFSSSGLKRRIVTLLAFVLDLTQQIPGLEQVNAALTAALGALGGTALLHAGAAGTLSQEKLAGVVSVLYALIGLSWVFPPLLPLVPYLTKAATVLATLRIGRGN